MSIAWYLHCWFVLREISPKRANKMELWKMFMMMHICSHFRLQMGKSLCFMYFLDHAMLALLCLRDFSIGCGAHQSNLVNMQFCSSMKHSLSHWVFCIASMQYMPTDPQLKCSSQVKSKSFHYHNYMNIVHIFERLKPCWVNLSCISTHTW